MNSMMLTALRLLTQREYSRQELTKRLQQQFSEAEVEIVVRECIEKKLLSDERFLESRIQHRISQGYGPQWIRQDLQSHQMDKELVAEMLAFDDDYWIEQASQLIARKYNNKDLKQHKQKLQRYLFQRGYSVAVIQKTLKRMLNVID
jgi:regulatory protein